LIIELYAPLLSARSAPLTLNGGLVIRRRKKERKIGCFTPRATSSTTGRHEVYAPQTAPSWSATTPRNNEGALMDAVWVEQLEP
jgi:hypothetical protein